VVQGKAIAIHSMLVVCEAVVVVVVAEAAAAEATAEKRHLKVEKTSLQTI
jgi:hypothetical protein